VLRHRRPLPLPVHVHHLPERPACATTDRSSNQHK
jgi:hypothetical protein